MQEWDSSLQFYIRITYNSIGDQSWTVIYTNKHGKKCNNIQLDQCLTGWLSVMKNYVTSGQVMESQTKVQCSYLVRVAVSCG